MSDLLQRERFSASIQATLVEHPDWLPDALAAVSSGMANAAARLNEARAKSDAACLAALGLLQTKRLSADVQKALNDTICRAIHPTSRCELEHRFVERAEALAQAADHD